MINLFVFRHISVTPVQHRHRKVSAVSVSSACRTSTLTWHLRDTNWTLRDTN